MGHTEGPGCYCYANDLLRGFLEKLAGSYSYVVLDNEAGLEHLSRRTTSNVDALLIVANPTATALRSAGRVHETVGRLKLDIGRSYLVLNRLNPVPDAHADSVDSLLATLAGQGLGLLGEVPYDEEVHARSSGAEGVLDLPGDTPAPSAVGELLAKLGM